MSLLRQEHTGRLKCLGRLVRGWEQICSVCSAASEAFGAVRTLSDPIQHAKSEEVGCWPLEPLNSLIGGVIANQCGVWEGRNTEFSMGRPGPTNPTGPTGSGRKTTQMSRVRLGFGFPF